MDSPSVPNPEVNASARREPPPAYAARTERARLLEAMVRVTAERGYEAATIADVVARADLSREDFDRYFSAKEDCFMAAYEAAVDVLVAHASAAFESAKGAPWADRVTASLRALVELLAGEAEIARMAIVEVAAIGEEARVLSRRGLDRFVPFLEQGRAASPQGVDLPDATARFAIGGASSMVFDEIRAGRGAELERILPELVFAVTMPYLGVEAAEAAMRRAREPN